MDQHLKEERQLDSECLSDEEVQAIIKRYGERQAGGDTGPTVADVAEALQVEPQVVVRLLKDIRTAESQSQLAERLESLEKENSELKARAQASHQSYDEFSCCTRWGRRRPRSQLRLTAVMVAVFVGLMVASGGKSLGAWSATMVIVAALACFIGMRLLRSGFRGR